MMGRGWEGGREKKLTAEKLLSFPTESRILLHVRPYFYTIVVQYRYIYCSTAAVVRAVFIPPLLSDCDNTFPPGGKIRFLGILCVWYPDGRILGSLGSFCVVEILMSTYVFFPNKEKGFLSRCRVLIDFHSSSLKLKSSQLAKAEKQKISYMRNTMEYKNTRMLFDKTFWNVCFNPLLFVRKSIERKYFFCRYYSATWVR